MTAQEAWKKRLHMIKKSKKLRMQSEKLRLDGYELQDRNYRQATEDIIRWNIGKKFIADGNELCCEADKLAADAEILFFTAVMKEHGNVKASWKWDDEKALYECRLSNGLVFKP